MVPVQVAYFHLTKNHYFHLKTEAEWKFCFDILIQKNALNQCTCLITLDGFVLQVYPEVFSIRVKMSRLTEFHKSKLLSCFF